MNEYTYDDIQIGMKESYTATVTDEHMAAFRAMTTDTNPLHADESFAKAKGHKAIVVFGMLTASFYSTIAGVYLPGVHSLIYSVDTKFLKPVYVGDTLTIEGVVKEKHDLFKYIILSCTIRNQHGEKVSKATMKVGVDNGE